MRTSAPILKLHDDILWRICDELNCDNTVLVPRMTVLRYTSQVCTSWRRFVLSASSLWGGILDIDSLSQKTHDWREEVMSRTGQSPLCVQGYVEGGGVQEEFVIMILMSHRARIRQWNLGFGANLSNRTEEMIGWAFQKPAPRLEYFEIDFAKHPSRFLSKKLCLFADNAPSLRHLSAFHFPIRPQTLLSSKAMCTLRFSGTNLFTAPELLRVLSCMPLLRTLEIISDEDELDLPPTQEVQNMQVVALPQLLDLKIDAGDAARKYLTILDHLVMEPRFNFHFRTNRVFPYPSDIATGQRVLQNYFPLSIDDEEPEELKLLMDNCLILISARSLFLFSFTMEFLEDIADPSIFLQSISSVSFAGVTSFELHFISNVVAPAITNLLPIISTLTSVETLDISDHTLPFILSLQPTLADGTVLLPCLQRLVLEGFDAEQDLANVIQFLSQRVALGLPMEELDFGWSTCEIDDQDLERLGQFTGLKVIWCDGDLSRSQRREHVCEASGTLLLMMDAPSIV
ncbi:hypothetical protein GALMADRAFT_766289 [Galerina marginata CBS 339.88]|uniref:F-box domain-containing protein n=1 Tax=Galerina marginata (strain CBS 339.88) TaxID=685588 RepID=A0A067SQA1_GALM3|nr:hypothetical protein GALMADRAFT_766289 [Galerina marginata CBS 339.88]